MLHVFGSVGLIIKKGSQKIPQSLETTGCGFKINMVIVEICNLKKSRYNVVAKIVQN